MTERNQSAASPPERTSPSPGDFLSALAEAIPVPVALLTVDARVRYANAPFVQTLAISKEHYLHKKFPRHWLVHPEEAFPQLRELLHRASQAEVHPEPVSLSLRAADGSEIRVEAYARPVPNRNQNSNGLIIATFKSIGPSEAPLPADRAKEAANGRSFRDELERPEERFRILFEYAPDGCYLCDLEGRFVDGNRAAERIVGYAREELIGKSFLKLNLLPKDQLARAAQILVNSTIGKPTGPDEFTLNRKDGSQVAVEIHTHPVHIQGQLLVLGIARDITARQQAQEALLREKAFSDSVINSMPGVFYMMDEQGHYAWWNKNLEDATECSGDEILGLHPTHFFEGADRQRVAEAMATVFAQGQVSIEADLVSKSGRKTPFFFTGVRVEREDKPYLIGLGIDITERRKTEAILEKLNAELETSILELERSNRDLSDFAHITAHDLKAPLRGIATMADWLDQDYGEKIGPEGRENLQLLRSRVDRMKHLINGILRYSEIGHRNLLIERVDTHALVQEVIEQIAAPDSVEIQIEGTLPTLPAERTCLMQVFQNLIGNAVKYIDKPRGSVHVSACDDEEFWQFRVADNGPGIEARHFARVFQMFQTLSSSDRDDSTGLGLAMVKKIVELSGGRVWLESEMGRGSTFIFTLPKQPQSAARKSDPTAQTPEPL